MDDACGCKECMDKKKYRLEGINLVEQKIEENLKKNIYTMGIPKAKITDAINQAKEEVK